MDCPPAWRACEPMARFCEEDLPRLHAAMPSDVVPAYPATLWRPLQLVGEPTEVRCVILRQHVSPRGPTGLCMGIGPRSSRAEYEVLEALLAERVPAPEGPRALPFAASRGATDPPAPLRLDGLVERMARRGILWLALHPYTQRGSYAALEHMGWDAYARAAMEAAVLATEGRCVVVALGAAAHRAATEAVRGRCTVIRTSSEARSARSEGREALVGSRCLARASALLEALGRGPLDWSS